MSLRFFLDHCVPRSAGDYLRSQGHEVEVLQEHLPCDAPDAQVIAKARQLGAVLVSLNGDFADIVAYPPDQHLGVVSLQLKNQPAVLPRLLQRLSQYLQAHPQQEHYRGKLLLVEAHRLRLRTV